MGEDFDVLPGGLMLARAQPLQVRNLRVRIAAHRGRRYDFELFQRLQRSQQRQRGFFEVHPAQVEVLEPRQLRKYADVRLVHHGVHQVQKPETRQAAHEIQLKPISGNNRQEKQMEMQRRICIQAQIQVLVNVLIP